jgi:CHAT domain-containing protein
MGMASSAQGDLKQALGYFELAQSLRHKLAAVFSDTASEAEAFNYLASLTATTDAYLSVTAQWPEAADKQYAAIWSGKALVTRIVQRRQALLRGLEDQATRAGADELLEVRRQLARLLLAPADPKDRDRPKQLQTLTERKERLERDLAQRIPALAREQALEVAPFTDLLKALPKDTAFLDLVRYHRFEKGQLKSELNYLAFVLQAGQPVRRIELGPAKAIEEPLEQWRKDIVNNHAGLAPEQLRRLLWDPLAKYLPTNTASTVYISPDGPLSALPWSALPGRQAHTVLLEDHALTLVPHGPFLLDLLTRTADRAEPRGELLIVGGVDYDGAPRAVATSRPAAVRSADRGDKSIRWGALPATIREVDQIRAIAEKQPTPPRITDRRRDEASTLQLQADLLKCRWAHLATHGFFAAPRTPERQALLDERFFLFDRGGERRAVGARNPLVQTGLVLAGANRPPAPDLLTDDRGILTAEAIAGMPLNHLDLVVLSACETGLGEAAAGEGVFGLQRAFHLAGTPAVIASLWKVDDEATAALMALFYHHLWDEKRSPREALRRAQLALYHHPEEISGLAKERGPNFDKVVKRVVGSPADPKQPQGKVAAVRQWAAFVLSGG